ncbi:MAG: amidohydrolase family protein [Gammaproteobacteria bacterium]
MSNITGTDPTGQRLPIKLDSTSNGEFAPLPLSTANHQANQLAQANASANAHRLHLGRRAFMVSLCGAASTLLAFNKANAAFGKRGGYFDVPADAALDPQLAQATLDGTEFIFDVQGHYVRPGGAQALKARCTVAHENLDRDYMHCIGADQFIKDVFLDSDTDMMVLSFVPSQRDAEPLSIEEADATRQIIEDMQGSPRLLLHGRVNPNQDGDLQAMDELAERWQVSAWKTYTQWGPHGQGFFMTDENSGIPFVENARRLGIKNICIHKGIPFGQESYQHSLCDDIGPIARQFPDVNFLIYHSGWVPGKAEGPYDPQHNEGLDSLIRSLQASEIPRNSNVYAELGSTWRGLMRDPDSAAHAIGKLLKYVGEDNVLWGTDSIWYGSPQDQIQAFRTFQISPEWQERYGYPALTPAVRAKIFGLNAIRPYPVRPDLIQHIAATDPIGVQKSVYQAQPDPHFSTHGPKTRREFLELLRQHGGSMV